MREGDSAETVTVTLFDGHQDVDALAFIGPEREPIEATFIVNLSAGLFDGCVVVALVAIGLANALRVFFELGGVKGLRKEVFKDDGVRNSNRLKVLHRATQLKAADVLIADELDLTYLYGGAFLDVEVYLDGCRRDVFNVELDGSELMAVLRQQLLEDRGGAQNPGRVVLAFNGEADFLFFEAVENVGL